MLTRYGTDNIIIMLIAGTVLLVASYFIDKLWLQIPLGLLGIILIVMTFVFFRDPERTVPQAVLHDNSLILAPSDGKIVQIIEIDENKYLKSKAVQISIFLSPLDVHVNRNPVSGIVEYYKYNPGQYLVAYHPKSSELNEHSLIGVSTPYGKVLFKQIVGILARRLVCELKVGDTVTIGERFGMMKFGSRMDVMIDTDSDIMVKVGDRVVAAETIIAKLRKNHTDN